MNDKPEYITCSANWYDDQLRHVHKPINIDKGLVVCGHRHHDVIYTYCQLTGSEVGDRCIEGFMTSHNRFVGRKEAAKVAFKAGQTKELKINLYSEDIY